MVTNQDILSKIESIKKSKLANLGIMNVDSKIISEQYIKDNYGVKI